MILSKASALLEFAADLVAFGRWRLAGVTALSVARSIAEGATYVTLIPLMGVAGLLPVAGGQTGTEGALLLWVREFAGGQPSLYWVLTALTVLLLARALAGYLCEIETAKLHCGYAHHVRARLYETMSRASWSYLARSRQARDTHALTTQTEMVEAAARYALRLLVATLTAVAGIAVAWAIDEATSALNPVDEAQVSRELRKALPNTTIFSIAHRLSSVTWTDIIVVLDGGRLVRYGPTPELLSADDGLLHDMRKLD